MEGRIMSLLLIVRKLWRYKLFTLPIFALVIAGSVYVFAVKAPTYEAGATYLLVNPPSPPTDAQIAAKPALGRIDSDNPYMRFSDLTVVVQVLATRLSSEEARKALANQGADPNYTVEPSSEFGFSAPIIQITGTGTTPAAAVHTADLVGEAVTKELDQMQMIRGVDELYRINAEVVVGAHHATLKASGKLRVLVAVFALGTILMFIAVSVLDAISALRVEWAQRRREDEAPAQREDDAPAQREDDAPAQPADDAPAQPADDAPAQPADDAPAQPADDAPAQPADDAPAQRADDAPAQRADEAPAGGVSSVPSSAPHRDLLSHPDPDQEASEWPLLIQR
jgi:hypothetical protein